MPSKLEERVAALEKQMAELKAELQRVAQGKNQEKDWRSTVGMFSGNEEMKALDAACLAEREKEREKARRQGSKRQRVSP
jgi:hypothetical protein